MSLPFFFVEEIAEKGREIELDEENSKHIVQVLRMQEAEKLKLSDGKGNILLTEIIFSHKKHCRVRVCSAEHMPRSGPILTIAISLIKNTGRFEWFLEKATEFGTAEIIPLICERTEKQHFRKDRFINICKSAMLQSGQSYMPLLHQPENFNHIMSQHFDGNKMIAHCMQEKKTLITDAYRAGNNEHHLILIGPEGDFTAQEISEAIQKGYIPVSLGNTRLRTETAGMYAAAICK